MELLFCKTDVELFQKTVPFKNNLDPYLLGTEQQIKKIKNIHPVLMEYMTYMQWPIRKLEYSFILKEVLPFIKKGCKTFDAGCGVTILAPFFAKLGAEAYGGDYDRDTIDYMKNSGKLIYNSTVNYSFQDLANISFDDNYFDIITCVSVLEHIQSPNDKKAIGEMLRVLKPGGRLVITVDFAPEERWTEKWHRRLSKGLSGLLKSRFKNMLPKRGSDPQRNSKQYRAEREANQEYNHYYLDNLIQQFKDYLMGEPNLDRNVSRRQIRNFWNKFHGEKRSYISAGLVFDKRDT